MDSLILNCLYFLTKIWSCQVNYMIIPQLSFCIMQPSLVYFFCFTLDLINKKKDDNAKSTGSILMILVTLDKKVWFDLGQWVNWTPLLLALVLFVYQKGVNSLLWQQSNLRCVRRYYLQFTCLLLHICTVWITHYPKSPGQNCATICDYVIYITQGNKHWNKTLRIN